MKIINRIIKYIFSVLSLVTVFVFAVIIILENRTADEYKVTKGSVLSIDSAIPISTHFEGAKQSQGGSYKVGETYKADLKLFGVIPFKTVDVQVVDDLYVAVLGKPFGMKIYTDGVLVIELSDVDTEQGNINPSEKAGIKVGDYIESVNGQKISCNEDLSDIVIDSQGKELEFSILRNKKRMKIKVKPVYSRENGSYRIGLWVRDSSAGIGTLTFYSPSSDIICGLGHGICDSDTGEILQLDSGEMVSAEIVAVTKGDLGSPGELKGSFNFETIANIDLNSELGVYGHLIEKYEFNDLTEIALKQDFHDGEAQILCTVSGEEPKLYSCTVKKKNSNYLSKVQNFTVTVTDKELLKKTGGIVQGMSGSPIIQDGKLVGAVTHVLVDDPTSGYGIFAENMLETAKSVSNSELDEAS